MGSVPAIDVLVLTAADGEDVALRAVDEGAVGGWEAHEVEGVRFGMRAFAVADGRRLLRLVTSSRRGIVSVTCGVTAFASSMTRVEFLEQKLRDGVATPQDAASLASLKFRGKLSTLSAPEWPSLFGEVRMARTKVDDLQRMARAALLGSGSADDLDVVRHGQVLSALANAEIASRGRRMTLQRRWPWMASWS